MLVDFVGWVFRKGNGLTAVVCATIAGASAGTTHTTGSDVNGWQPEQLELENSFPRWFLDFNVWSLSWDD